MSKIKSLALAAVVATAALSTAQSAHACSKGFLAQLGCATGVLTPEQAQRADDWHARLGRPLEQFNPVGRPPAPAPMPAPRTGGYPQYGGPEYGHPGFAPPVLPMPPVVQWRPMPHPGYAMPLRHHYPRPHYHRRP